TDMTNRALSIDRRLPKGAALNKPFYCDRKSIQMQYLIKVIGILIHQGKVDEAVNLFISEKSKWKFKVANYDWGNLSTYLSWRYLLSKQDCEEILENIAPRVNEFLLKIGYNYKMSIIINRSVLLPQSNRLNHYRYGKIIGSV